MSDELNFDLSPVEEAFTGPDGKRYVLREASEATNIKLRGMQLKNAKLRDGKLEANIENVAESQSALVSFCCFAVFDEQPPEKWPNVPLATVRNWPSRIVKRLFDRIRKVSELDADTEDAVFLKKRIEADTAKLAALRGEEECQEGNAAPGE